ncbi:hypothetical protein Vadar_031892 [Vaccinium darrowii]|uniref:Uncharacterized protein n=1 Tax=Vaccinium darrowii TaxID=229202 RepID=A0ACB7ZPB8_9ERIC|nr:hypothetical protein Vadar_031892 [Vaccinium darrowii]
MAKVPANTFLLLRKRAYGVGVENVRVQVAAASETRNNAVVDTSDAEKEMPVAEKKEQFWMKDPKTGNWIPETHFNDVDVAELRDKFLPSKTKH